MDIVKSLDIEGRELAMLQHYNVKTTFYGVDFRFSVIAYLFCVIGRQFFPQCNERSASFKVMSCNRQHAKASE